MMPRGWETAAAILAILLLAGLVGRVEMRDEIMFEQQISRRGN